MTSLDGPGFSVTLLKATDEMFKYLDTPVQAAGWSPGNMPSFDASNPVVLKKDRVVANVADDDETDAPSSDLKRRPMSEATRVYIC